jgi:hypothetical protein
MDSIDNHEHSVLGRVCRCMVVLCDCRFYFGATSCSGVGRLHSCISYACLEGSE